jgi:hypothetical protein
MMSASAARTPFAQTMKVRPEGRLVASLRDARIQREGKKEGASANYCEDLGALGRPLHLFERHWNAVAERPGRGVTRDDFTEIMDRRAVHKPELQARLDAPSQALSPSDVTGR